MGISIVGRVKQDFKVQATLLDSLGSALEIGEKTEMKWVSSDESIFVVKGLGAGSNVAEVIMLSPGSGVLTCAIGDLVQTTDVTVIDEDVPASIQITLI